VKVAPGIAGYGTMHWLGAVRMLTAPNVFSCLGDLHAYMTVGLSI